jgi:ATP-binding cassette subfamily A (ABC1) protein 3
MVNGQFRCLGSPQHLKSTFGKGYSLLLKVRADPDAERTSKGGGTTEVMNFILSTFDGSAVREQHHG